MYLLNMLMPPERKLQRIILKSFLHPIEFYVNKPDLQNDSARKCLLGILKHLGTHNMYILRCIATSKNITIQNVFVLDSKASIYNRLNRILACNYCYLGNTVKDDEKIAMKQMRGQPVQDKNYTRLKKQLQRLDKKDIASMTTEEFSRHKALYQILRSDIEAKETMIQMNLSTPNTSRKCHTMTPANFQNYCGRPLNVQTNIDIDDYSSKILPRMMKFLEKQDWETLLSGAIPIHNQQTLEIGICSEEEEEENRQQPVYDDYSFLL